MNPFLFSFRVASGLAAALAFLLPGAPRSEATDRTWTGSSGVDNQWMTPGNWQGGVAPVAGDNLIFQGVANAGNSTNYNNYPSGTMFGKITIATASDQDFSLGGNRVVLTNGIAETAGGIGINALAGFVYFDVTLGANQTFSASRALYLNGTVDVTDYTLTLNNSGSVTFRGTVTNSVYGGSIIKTNTGTLTFASGAQLAPLPAQTWLVVEIEQGSLVMDGVGSNAWFQLFQGSMVLDGVAGMVAIYGGGFTISGSGMASDLFAENGDLTPGDNGAPGVLSCNEFSCADYATLQIKINGTTPGTGYSQILVYSNYSLADFSYGSLAVQWGYTPQMGDSFNIIAQTSNEPYEIRNSSIFSGLPPDCIYDVTNGYSFGVSYDTNGVTLTTIRAPDSPFVLWKGSLSADLSTYGDRNWSSSNNWAQGLVPGTGSHVEFTPYQYSDYAFDAILPPPLTNDLSSGTSVASLLFTGTNYALYGNPLTITGGITNQTSSGTNFCYLDVATTGPLTLEADTGGTLLMGGSFDGSGTVSKAGGGRLIYTGTTMDSFVGSVAVDNGTLQVDGSFTDGSFTVNGGLLDGTGTVSGVTLNGGTLKPGDSPGIFHIQGDLTMAVGAVFQAELNGPVPGSGYDQLQVNGGVNLNGATLNLQPGYAAGPGAAFLILVNDGTDPIVGTFAGLPEGAVFQAGGQYFSISYKAGSGNNDVVVTRVNPPGNFKNITLLKAGTAQLQGLGGSNVTYTVQANTNLATTNWLNIGTAPANGLGVFYFNDTNVPANPQRFFRILPP